MKNTKRLLLNTLGIMFMLFSGLGISEVVLAAAPYPSKPVRFIVPMAPGGGTDIIARLIAAKLTERLGKQVIVENHGGGGGTIGTEMAAKAAPDGHTLLIVNPTRTIQPSLEKLPYDLLKSFTPVARIGTGPHVFVVSQSVPANSLKEFIALAKQKPGQMFFASSGVGSLVHLELELFKIMADIDVKMVQFKGTGPAVIDLLGGHSHAMIGSTAGCLPHIKSGKIRPLGTGGPKRSDILPDVPTIAEAGVPGYQAVSWFGIIAPAGTPALIIDRLNKDLQAVLALDELKKVLEDDGLAADHLGPTEFGKFLEQDVARWADVIKRANIKIEK